MRRLNENDYFKTPDLGLCAALCCAGYQIEAVDRQNPARVIFLVRRDEGLDDVIQEYVTHQLRVDPMEYFARLKELKNRLYNF